MKQCSKCLEIKPRSEYSKSPRGKNGLRSNCKSCDRVRCRKWKDKNPEKVIAANLRRDSKRKENPKAEMLRRAKKRSNVRNLDFSITEEDIEIPANCPVFGEPLEFSNSRSINRFAPSLDRVNPSLGYVKDNIEVISYKANAMKSDATSEELQLFALWVLEKVQLTPESKERIKILNDRLH